MELWEWLLSNVKDNEMKARIRGVQTAMESFDFVFCCSLSQTILRQPDNLSKTLQHSHISAAQGQELASLVVKTLSKDCNTEMFDNFGKIQQNEQKVLPPLIHHFQESEK